MIIENILQVGDVSDNGQVTIVDEDRLCYLVKSESRGAVGLRTISKALLNEYVAFFSENPDAAPNVARDLLCGKSDIDKYEYGYTSTLSTMAKMVIANSGQTPATTGNRRKVPNVLQQIFYGAPGTGKSNTIKRNVDNENKICFRTTFHPDSDYATFVGAYKPSMKPTGAALASGEKEEVITYKFVPQAFTKAYAAAWNTTEDVFLVIEEINRGNCAQIFGDLFQLLDRKGGRSEYPIEADTDLANYLQDALSQKPAHRHSTRSKERRKAYVAPKSLHLGNHEHQRPVAVPHRLGLQTPLGLGVYTHQAPCRRELQDKDWHRNLRLVGLLTENKQRNRRHHPLGRQEAGIFLCEHRIKDRMCRKVRQQGVVLSLERRV